MPTIPSMPSLRRFYKEAKVVEHPESGKLPKLAADRTLSHKNLSLSKDGYFAISLDSRPLKTLYKDLMPVPSKVLALALAEEWESQGEKVDLKTMHLNQMYSKAIRAQIEPTLRNYMQNEIMKYLENDQICYQEDPESKNDNKRALALEQIERTKEIFEFLESEFEVSLKVWNSILIEPQDKSVHNVRPFIEELDPISLNSLFQIT